MKKLTMFSVAAAAVLGLLAIIVIGCGSVGGGSSVSRYYFATASFDDSFDITMTNNTIYAKKREDGFWISGSYSMLSTKFLKAVVKTSSVPDAVGSVFYGLELPGTCVVFVATSEGLVTVGAAKTATTPEADDYALIQMPFSGWDTSDIAYMVAELVATGPNVFQGTLEGFDLGDSPVSTLNDSYVFYPASSELRGATTIVNITESGFLVGFDSSNGGGFSGVKNDTVDLSDLASHEYRALVYSSDTSSQSEYPIALKAVAHPWMPDSLQVFAFIGEPEGNSFTTDSITLEFTSQDGEGIIHANLYSNGGAPLSFRMVATKVLSANKFVATGISNDGATPYNVIMVQVD